MSLSLLYLPFPPVFCHISQLALKLAILELQIYKICKKVCLIIIFF